MKKILLGILLCVLLAGSAFAAMSDGKFLEEFRNISGNYSIKGSEDTGILQIKDDGKETLSIIGEKGEQVEWGFMKFNRITGEVTKNETFDFELWGQKSSVTVILRVTLISSGGKITGSGTMQFGDEEVQQLFVEKISD